MPQMSGCFTFHLHMRNKKRTKFWPLIFPVSMNAAQFSFQKPFSPIKRRYRLIHFNYCEEQQVSKTSALGSTSQSSHQILARLRMFLWMPKLDLDSEPTVTGTGFLLLLFPATQKYYTLIQCSVACPSVKEREYSKLKDGLKAYIWVSF